VELILSLALTVQINIECSYTEERPAEDDVVRMGKRVLLPLFSQMPKVKMENQVLVELDNYNYTQMY
jgi:hypothetical protein